MSFFKRLWMIIFTFFFFSSRRRHTRLQGDWSSDVCSSDLKQSQARDIAQMAVMGAGLGLFLLGLDQRSATAPNPALGNVLAAICAVTWAFTVMGYRWLAARGASVAAAAVSGNLTAGTIALVMAQPLAAGRTADWAVVAFLGVCQLGIPYLFLARAVPRVRALEVGLFLLIEPVLNPIRAWLVHGETPGPTTLAGGALVLRATAGPRVFYPRALPRP